MRRLAIVLVAVGLAQTARAEENRWNVHLQTGPVALVDQPTHTSSDQDVAAAGFDVRLGLEFEPAERWGVELAYGIDALPRGSGVPTLVGQNLLAGARVRPWYSKSGGYILPRSADRKLSFDTILSDVWVDAHVGASLADHNRFIYDVGIGARVPLTSPLQVGIFVRWQHAINFSDAGKDSFQMVVVGLQFSLGFVNVHPEHDSDGDGVPDSQDKCPETPTGVYVNQWGCPRDSGKTTSTGEPACGDTDLDGVCDGEDACPDTPPNTKVDAKGCPAGGSSEPPPDDNPPQSDSSQ